MTTHKTLPPLTRGQVIRLFLLLRGFDQDGAAALAGISRTTVARIMRDEPNIMKDATLMDVCGKLGMSPPQILKFPWSLDDDAAE